MTVDSRQKKSARGRQVRPAPDIVERLEQELAFSRRQVRDLRQQVEFILETTGSGFYVVTPQHELRYVDPRTRAITRVLEPAPCYRQLMGRSTPCPECPVPRALAQKTPAVAEMVAPADEGRPMRVTSVAFQAADNQWLAANIAVDISAHRHAEEAVRESEQRFRQIFESIRDGMLIIDVETKEFVAANSAASRMLGYDIEELVTLKIDDIHCEEDMPDVLERFQRQVAGELYVAENLRIRRKGGSILYCDVGSSPLNLCGRACLTSVFRDVTERRRADQERLELEAQLQHTQRLQSVGTLASGVAHEINNPLNGMINYAQLIRDRLGDGDESLNEFADEIITEGQRIANIARSLLNFAQSDGQEPQEENLGELIDGVLPMIQSRVRRDHITLDFDIPEQVPVVMCRGQHVQQVIMILLGNACDALNERYADALEGKNVRICARLLDNEPERFVRMTVEDNGPGIPTEVRERLFDPFFTTKDRATNAGLGLAISHTIVRDHGGVLTVESEPGAWSRFHVDLPVAGEGDVSSE